MKQYTKLILLVIFALFLTLTACQRPASRAPIASPTPSLEAGFPVTPDDQANQIRTQTAAAQEPSGQPTGDAATVEPGGEAATTTPEPEGDTEAGGGTEGQPEAPADQEDQDAGGGGPAANIPPIERPESYTLMHGEFPYCIARRFDVDIASLLSANGLNQYSRVPAGTVLRIPGATWNPNHGSRALRSHPATITVGGGDSLYSIACRYGDVSPEQILAANNLSSAADIRSGMQLNIP